jgi:hypothetical protein
MRRGSGPSFTTSSRCVATRNSYASATFSNISRLYSSS